MKQILWFSIVLAVGTYICGPLIDPDLWWHITSGRWIIANLEIPRVDQWNLFAMGKPWRAYSWSSEIVLALTDRAAGEQGLLALKLVLAVFLAGCLLYCFTRLAGDGFFGGLLGVFAVAACAEHFTLRPQSLVWICFTGLILLAERVRRDGLTGRSGFLLFLLMALWANTHITTALGLAAVFGWLYRPGQVRQAFQVLLICFAGTLFTPYLGGEWLTLFQKAGHPFWHQSIPEFRPATLLHNSTGLFLILAAAYCFFLHRRPGLLRPAAVLSCLFSLLGLIIVKFLPFAVLFMAADLASMWQRETDRKEAFAGLHEGLERLRNLLEKIPREGLAFLLICCAIVNIFKVWREPVVLDDIPREAMDFVIAKNLPFPLLNNFSSGGYVMYRLSDAQGNLSHPVSIDGRTNLIPDEVWQKEVDAFFGRENWKDYVDLVNPASILWPNQSPLTSILLAGTSWCRVFGGAQAPEAYSVFLKKSELQKRQGELKSDNCR